MIKRNPFKYKHLTNENLNPDSQRADNLIRRFPVKHQEISNTSPEIPRVASSKQKGPAHHQKLTGDDTILALELKIKKIEQQLSQQFPNSNLDEITRDINKLLKKLHDAEQYHTLRLYAHNEQIRDKSTNRMAELAEERAQITTLNNLRKRLVSTQNKIVSTHKHERQVAYQKQIPHKVSGLQQKTMEITGEIAKINNFMANIFKEQVPEQQRKIMWENAANNKRLLEKDLHEIRLQRKMIEITDELTKIDDFLLNPPKGQVPEHQMKLLRENAIKKKRLLEKDLHEIRQSLAQLEKGNRTPNNSNIRGRRR